MISFGDKRGRFKCTAPWDVSAANPHADNKTKLESKTDLAKRGERTSFRLTTTEDPVLLQKMAEDEVLAARESESNQSQDDNAANQSDQSEESGISYDL